MANNKTFNIGDIVPVNKNDVFYKNHEINQILTTDVYGVADPGSILYGVIVYDQEKESFYYNPNWILDITIKGKLSL